MEGKLVGSKGEELVKIKFFFKYCNRNHQIEIESEYFEDMNIRPTLDSRLMFSAISVAELVSGPAIMMTIFIFCWLIRWARFSKWWQSTRLRSVFCKWVRSWPVDSVSQEIMSMLPVTLLKDTLR